MYVLNEGKGRINILAFSQSLLIRGLKNMRQERDKLSEKLSKMTREEIIDYFNKRKSQTTIKPSA
jgi:predicted flavoprotein YhiN